MNFRLTDEPGHWKNAVWETGRGKSPCLPKHCLWLEITVRNPGVAADREKFAIASRHGNIGVNYNSEAKPNMSKIVIVYSQPG
jgi:hypothetical protein